MGNRKECDACEGDTQRHADGFWGYTTARTFEEKYRHTESKPCRVGMSQEQKEEKNEGRERPEKRPVCP